MAIQQIDSSAVKLKGEEVSKSSSGVDRIESTLKNTQNSIDSLQTLTNETNSIVKRTFTEIMNINNDLTAITAFNEKIKQLETKINALSNYKSVTNDSGE